MLYSGSYFLLFYYIERVLCVYRNSQNSKNRPFSQKYPFLPILGKYPIFAYFSHISKNALFFLFSYICGFCQFSHRHKKCPIFAYFLIFFIF